MDRPLRMRWLSLAGVLGGVLLIGYDLASIHLPSSSARGWQAAFGLSAALGLALGLIGSYAYQADRAGWSGLGVFTLMQLGVMALFTRAWLDWGRLPADGELSALFGIGMAFFGVMTWRMDMLPRLPAVGLTAGGLLGAALYIWPELGSHLLYRPWLLVGAGASWLGFSLWRGE